MVEDVWQQGLEELVQWNSGLRGMVEEVWPEVWQEGLEELVWWNSGVRGVVEEVWQEGLRGQEAARATTAKRGERNKWRAGQAHA